MYLKRLEIFGFKSFAEKTVLEFFPGITIIVGPNGCGKSNILDAIRWALGEQSTRSLRASRMEDVIFNGTDRTPPLNLAEVSVAFDNSDRFLNYDADEVVITRRLFRSGESEYLINRNQVRLKDISELLMGTGIGAESYSIIEQGKIDLLLSVKPDDRRLVFDEAAGITKYKAKKRETLRKLAETEQNLIRVDDIINEVRRQLNSLERQARKAKRYQELYNQLKEKEIFLALRQVFDMEQEKARLSSELESIRASLDLKQQLLSERSQELEEMRKRAFDLEERINQVQERLGQVRSEHEQGLLKISMAQERIAELKRQKEIFSREREQLLVRMEERQDQIKVLKEEIKKQEENLLRLKQSVEAGERELEGLVSDLRNKEVELESVRSGLFEDNHNLSSLRNREKDLELELNSLHSQRRHSQEQRQQVEGQIRVMQEKLSSYRNKIEELAKELDLCQGPKMEEIEAKIRQGKEDCSRIESEIEQVKGEIASVETQKEILSHLEAKYITLPQERKIDVWVEKAEFEIGSIVARVDSIIEENNNWIHLSCSAKVLPRHLSDIDDLLANLGNRLKELEEGLVNAKSGLDRLYEERRELERRIAALNSEIKHQESLINSGEQSIKEYSIQMDVLNEEVSNIDSKIAMCNDEMVGLKEDIKNLEEEISERNRHIVLLEEEIEQIRRNRLEREQTLSKLRAERDVISANLDNLKGNLESILNNLKEEERVVAERSQLQDEIEARIKELEEEIDRIKGRSIDWERTIDSLQSERDSLRDNYQELRGQLDRIEGEREDLNSQVDRLKADAYQLELKVQEISFKVKSIASHLMEIYGVDLEEAKNSVILPIGLDLDVLQEEIDSLKEKIRRMGTVSTIAIEEYEELRQRYEFLESQREDLLKAKSALKEAINKLNRTSEELFVQTFSQIREEFKRFFRMLFGGGNANISIINEDDVLESGIEITARPPGKQLRSISLLSGGEKSLTAIALIFAIFRVKPSPFCILDEVEAALDETNVDRFVRLLKEFSKKSQFLIISHNKKTIACGDVIYGVTMPTTGISKIISVKLVDEESPRRDVAEFINR